MSWSTVEEAIEAFRAGKMVLVMDGADREDECDLVFAAESTTAEQMAFAIRHTTGIVCVVGDKERLEHFGLHPATTRNTDANATNFYVSTDYLPGTLTGFSAADRAATSRALCDMSLQAEAFSKPGHLFPLCARPGGVLERPGHTESTYDLCLLSGVTPVGCLAELMHDDGTMYRQKDSLEFARTHGFPIVTVEQLIEFRRRQVAGQANQPQATLVAQPTAGGKSAPAAAPGRTPASRL
mmetsp:Transcript_59639/g.156791  ORF Transcript_59639/g.156791 Transcript_59639/m.156791 type:complete len:239 (+) Transcript_59639:70-786(+)